MVHVGKITVSKAAVADKQTDNVGPIFLSVWLFVFTWIMANALGSKDTGNGYYYY